MRGMTGMWVWNIQEYIDIHILVHKRINATGIDFTGAFTCVLSFLLQQQSIMGIVIVIEMATEVKKKSRSPKTSPPSE